MEMYAWLPQLSRWIVEIAVRILPKEHRERWREEFEEAQSTFPQTAWRIFHALSLLYGAFRMSNNLASAKRGSLYLELDGTIESVLTTYRHSVRNIQDCAEMSKELSDDKFELSLLQLQSTASSLSGRFDEKTVSGLTKSIEDLSKTLLNAREQTLNILVGQTTKVAKRLSELDSTAVALERKWFNIKEIMSFLRGVPILESLILAWVARSVVREVDDFVRTMRAEARIDPAELERATKIAKAIGNMKLGIGR